MEREQEAPGHPSLSCGSSSLARLPSVHVSGQGTHRLPASASRPRPGLRGSREGAAGGCVTALTLCPRRQLPPGLAAGSSAPCPRLPAGWIFVTGRELLSITRRKNQRCQTGKHPPTKMEEVLLTKCGSHRPRSRELARVSFPGPSRRGRPLGHEALFL